VITEETADNYFKASLFILDGRLKTTNKISARIADSLRDSKQELQNTRHDILQLYVLYGKKVNDIYSDHTYGSNSFANFRL
jgi:hypothetical protein